MSNTKIIINKSTNDTELIEFLLVKCKTIIVDIDTQNIDGPKSEKQAARFFRAGQRKTCQHIIDEIITARLMFAKNIKDLQ